MALKKKTTTTTTFVHYEDKCPEHCTANTAGTCSLYNTQTSALSYCAGHRNVGTERHMVFQQYDVGSTIDHPQPNTVNSLLQTEIGYRRAHTWYSGLQNSAHSDIHTGDLITHEQENVLNNAIDAMNVMINGRSDYGLGSGKIVHGGPQYKRPVVTGDLTRAEDLHYLERNILADFQDCICYADCTCHGLSTTTEICSHRWCSAFGGVY